MTKECNCDYPGCRTNGEFAHELKITNESDAAVNLMFCKYHKILVSGAHFTAMVDRSKDKIDFIVQGPFLEVEIAEQVLMARELTKKKE